MSDMPTAVAPRGGPISLDELILLNDEIRSLLRAGIPLELGLRGSAARIRGRLGELTERLATRVESGTSLVSALDAEQDRIPSTYRAILAAGVRSGRFDDVLGSVSEYAASLRDLRSHVRRALVYPGMVIGLGYALFVGLMLFFVPEVDRTYRIFRIQDAWWLPPLRWLHETVWLWGPGLPLAAMVLIWGPAAWDWLRGVLAPGGADRSMRLGLVRNVPGVGGVIRNAQLARFAHLFAVLAEHGVPFAECARLSAAGTGDRRLTDSMHDAASLVESGRPLDEALKPDRALSPFLRWQILMGARQSRLAPALRQAAEVYRQRAMIRADWIQQVLPVLLVLVIGGGATVLYALIVFVPLSSLWKTIAG